MSARTMEHPVFGHVLAATATAMMMVLEAGSPSVASAACPPVSRDYERYQAALTFVPFTSDRLAVSVCYPERVFRRAEDRPDGILFVADDGLAWFRLFHRANAGRRSIRDLMAAEEKHLRARNATITYRRTKGDWFVLSGYIGTRIYYRRSVLTHEGATVDTLVIEFPQEQKPFYYDIVRRMSWSFQPR